MNAKSPDRKTVIAGLLACVISACGSTVNNPAPSGKTSSHASVTPVTTADPCSVGAQSPPTGNIGANYATALAFAPDGRLFYAQRSGQVMVWQDGKAVTFATVPTVTTERGGGYSERGLLGLALSPTFSKDRYVYAFYSDVNYTEQHVIRWKDCNGTGRNGQVIITVPSGGDCCHKGGRLAFGSDGKLYVTLGEEHDAPAAQNQGDVRGKILRYNPDGSVPADNPFGATNPVWAYGFRNPFGIAFSASGALAVTSNGPSGDYGSPSTGYDVAFLNVARGGGYQWPLCYGYSHALTSASCGGQSGPDWSSENSTYVPTGATFADAHAPAQYAGHFIFCSYDRGMVILTPGSPHPTASSGPSQCRFDVKEGPDHAIYFSDVNTIYRVSA